MTSGRLAMKRLARRWVTTLLPMVLLAPTLPSQPTPARSLWRVAPAGRDVHMLAERRFDVSTGLRASTAFAMVLDGDGVPLLGADDGLYRYAGGHWRREALPPGFEYQQVRSLLRSRDGALWIGTRRGLIRRGTDSVDRVFSEADGLQGAVVFSLVESPAVDGTPRVVAGTSRGVSWFDGTRFVPLEVPPTYNAVALMLAATIAPDGTPELWMASALDGVVKYARGATTLYRAPQGLVTPDAQVLLGIATGAGATVGTAGGDAARDVVRLYAGGSGGVFALTRRNGRDEFVRVPGSPTDVYRLELVPAGDGTGELWAGTVDGQLYRRRGNAWSTVSTSLADRHGTVTLLEAVEGHGGVSAVYASSRTGYLIRLSHGVAGALRLMPNGVESIVHAIYAEPGADGRDAVWAATHDHGLLHVQASGTMQQYAVGGSRTRRTSDVRRVSFAAPDAPVQDSVITVIADGIVWRQSGGRFEPLTAGVENVEVHAVLRTLAPDGVSALHAATADGLRRWDGATWVRVFPEVQGVVTSLAAVPEPGGLALYVGGPNRVRIVRDRRVVSEPLPAAAVAGVGTGSVRRLCSISVGGSPRVFLLDSDRGVLWRGADGNGWRTLPSHLQRLISTLGVSDVLCLRDGRVAIGTFAGLAVFDVAGANPARWRAITQVADADGLPSSGVVSLPTSTVSEVMWVGTTFGVGVVDLQRAALVPPARLQVRVISEVRGRAIADGAQLPAGEADLHVDPMLFTYHREELTRFRIGLENAASSSADAPAPLPELPAGDWPEVATRSYHDLAPGRYALSVWAYDWAGREYGPVVRTFTLRAAWWQTWPARAIALLVLLSVLVLAYRWRVRTIREAAERLRDGERKAEAERAWFQAQVREAQKLESLGTLAGGVAHDFNNLLGVIRGNAELARTALRRNRSNDDNLGAILDASDRARDIVRQILTFSRRSTPVREYVNLSRLVLDLQPLLRRMIPRTVRLEITGADDALLLMGDPTQLQQLLLNLVSNAEYAMRARTDGVLTIALSRRTVPADQAPPVGEVVILEVRDTGLGMSEEVRGRIFEPFFTTKPTGEGTGLGMAVVHGIVVGHDGRAEVFSTEGQGTTFSLRFPMAVIEGLWDEDTDPTALLDVHEPEADGQEVPEHDHWPATDVATAVGGTATPDAAMDVLEESPYAGTTIVVVDDEPAVARVVERALQHYGHVVHLFASPEQALQFIQQQPSNVDLLITDQTMPGMTGDLLAEAVHTLRGDLPVLILTGFSHRLTPERIAAARAHAVLLKPVELAVLKQRVDEALALTLRR